MKRKMKIASFAFFFLLIGSVSAQENIGTSGGEATGSGGSSSFSIGQTFYITNDGTNGSVSQGVQQPYEITVTSGVEEKTIYLDMNVYPNPTNDILNLTVAKSDGLTYQLTDINGKVLDSNKVYENTTYINTVDFSNATYFLKVISNNQVIKTFKIIKSE